jgi:hypothetical protein
MCTLCPEEKKYCKSLCKKCYRKQYYETKGKIKNTEYYWNRIEKVRKYSKEKWKNDCEVLKEDNKRRYKENRDSRLEQKREYNQKNKNNISAYKKEYHQRPKSKKLARAKNAKRNALKIKATPFWADLEAIKEFYLNCPEGYEVDHIVPLRNKFVCGLHILENLQYLSKSENCSKNNKSDGTLQNESWRLR